jgi:hypothetical protein
MTYRDANANDMTDFLDQQALSAGAPTFPELPPLAAAGDTPQPLQCSTTGPGTVPPASGGSHARRTPFQTGSGPRAAIWHS